jgi:hypothetical protein
MIIARVYDQLSSLTSKQFYSLAVLLLSIPFFILFRSIALQPSQRLFDTTDYPLQVWVVSSTLENFKSGFTNGLFFGNAFFPEKSALLFGSLAFGRGFCIAIFFICFKSYCIVEHRTTLYFSTHDRFCPFFPASDFYITTDSVCWSVFSTVFSVFLFTSFPCSVIEYVAGLFWTWTAPVKEMDSSQRNTFFRTVFIQFISSVYFAFMLGLLYPLLSRLLFEREKSKVSVQQVFKSFLCHGIRQFCCHISRSSTYSVTRDPGSM